VEALEEHSAVHAGPGSGRKRKVTEEAAITPIIQAMPKEYAKKRRAVYDGPSKSFGVGQKRGK
jgi:hypothetical protein